MFQLYFSLFFVPKRKSNYKVILDDVSIKTIRIDLWFVVLFLGYADRVYPSSKAVAESKLSAEVIRKDALLASKIVMDATKRKSLRPSNREKIPDGWEEVAEKFITKPLPQNRSELSKKEAEVVKDDSFMHKFYGSQLVIGDLLVGTNLPVKLHTLEITKDNKVFIDNNPYAINHHDVGQMKVILKKLQKDKA